MKEDDNRNNQQKQMLINRLYKSKSKNPQNVGKALSKNEDDTKLLFYVLFNLAQQTRKRSFREREDEGKFGLLPKISIGKKFGFDEELGANNVNNVSLMSARRTSRGNSFSQIPSEK